ncbi:S-adenosyl-L-methionine-dependent methyltransferase [Atractiella rhizophila]|nr:S-adenosyl-L-methionine-dependent methyltransferase [Atractiella rhizophila]
MMDESLPSSRLGTKEHWDQVYSREVSNFEETGDEGEVWFGEAVAASMVRWSLKHVPATSSPPPNILDLGTGNGHLLRLFVEEGYPEDGVVGMDYSPASVELAERINEKEGCGAVRVFVGDILQDLEGEEWNTKMGWDLVCDKGTFDAICLMEQKEDEEKAEKKYFRNVLKLIKPAGFFLITSCNWTTPELRSKFESDDLEFYVELKPAKQFTFGGRQGQTTSTVAFKRRNRP